MEKGPVALLGLQGHHTSPGSGASPRLCTQVEAGAGTGDGLPGSPRQLLLTQLMGKVLVKR